MGGKDVHVNSASRRDNNYAATCQSSVQDAPESLSRLAERGNPFQTQSETYRYAVDKGVGGGRIELELICTLLIVVDSGRGTRTRQMSRGGQRRLSVRRVLSCFLVPLCISNDRMIVTDNIISAEHYD